MMWFAAMLGLCYEYESVDATELWRRVQIVAAAPPLGVAGFLPPRGYIGEQMRFSQSHLNWLDDKCIMYPDEFAEWRREARWLARWWGEAQTASDPRVAPFYRYESLAWLRKSTPTWGEWPPCVPLWRFYEE